MAEYLQLNSLGGALLGAAVVHFAAKTYYPPTSDTQSMIMDAAGAAGVMMFAGAQPDVMTIAFSAGASVAVNKLMATTTA